MIGSLGSAITTAKGGDASVFDALDIEFATHGCRRQILETLHQHASAVSDEELATTLRLPRKTMSADLAQLAEKEFVKLDHARSITEHRVTITEYGELMLDVIQKQAPDASHVH
jgi:predicted transcriptional regulator